MQNEMETTVVYWVSSVYRVQGLGFILSFLEVPFGVILGLYRGYIEIMENQMETII